MSLLDILNGGSGGLGGLGGGKKKTKVYDFGPDEQNPTPVSWAPEGNQDPAANSRERGAPERFDLNKYFADNSAEPNDAVNAMAAIGETPGFVYERPLAIASTLAGGQIIDESGKSFIGDIPLLGDLVGGIGDAITNLQLAPSAGANSMTIDTLAKGYRGNWSDDTIVERDYGDPRGAGFGKKMTWGEYKAQAAARGFTSQDVEDFVDGKKTAFDYGDKPVIADPMGNLIAQMAFDPLNLVFAAGPVLKVAQGVGLLGKMVEMGAVSSKALTVTEAAVKAGIGKESTWLGLAKYFETAGRGAASIPGGSTAVGLAATAGRATLKGAKVYQKTALAASAGQVGLLAAGNIVKNTPVSGFLEPLFELNQAAFDNRPLSRNMAFAIFSAAHFPMHTYVGKLNQARRTAMFKAQGGWKGIEGNLLKSLGEGWDATPDQVRERFGGVDEFRNFVYHISANIAFDKIYANPKLKAALSHYDSLQEAAMKNRYLADLIVENIQDMYASKKITGRDLDRRMRDWFANRESVNNNVDFPWSGKDAIDRWHEYAAVAAPVSDVFYSQAQAVIGLADTLPQEALTAMQSALKTRAIDGAVPIDDLRSWLSRNPQLVKKGEGEWVKYLLRDWDGKNVPFNDINRLLRREIKNAPTVRELTSEFAGREAAAAREWRAGETDTMTESWMDPETRPGAMAVSRMRPEIAQRLGMRSDSVADVMSARRDADVLAFEQNIGREMSDAGFEVDSVTNSLGSWEGSLEPSVEVGVNGANLYEMRLAATTSGMAGIQDAVALSVSGAKLRAMGLAANGYEIIIKLPDVAPQALQAVKDRLSKDLPGFTINDTTGTVRVLLKDVELTPEFNDALALAMKDIEDIYPKGAILAETAVSKSVHPAYIEFIGQSKKKGADVTYQEVLRDARSNGDPRANAHKAIGKRLANGGADAGNARSPLGSREAVGRLAGAGLGESVDPAVAAQALDPRKATVDPAFAYHATPVENLTLIAEDKLRPHAPKDGGSWANGGGGKRLYFADSPVEAAASVTIPRGLMLEQGQVAVLRVQRSRLYNLKGEYSGMSGDPFFTNRALGAGHVEIWYDGRWHNLKSTMDAPLPEGAAPRVAEVAPAYDAAGAPLPTEPALNPYTRPRLEADLQAAFNMTADQATDAAAIMDAYASSWASKTGRPVADFWDTRLAGIIYGGEPGMLLQIQALQRQIKGLQGPQLRATIDGAPEPKILNDHGLGGSSPIEWIADDAGHNADGMVGIPGGLKGLDDGSTWSLWDVWKLQSQGLDPSLMEPGLRAKFYDKHFRTMERGNSDPLDVFNRQIFAVMSPQNNLTQNQAAVGVLRVRNVEDLNQYASITRSAREANPGLGPKALAQVVGDEIGKIRPGYKAGVMITRDKLGYMALNAEKFADNPGWFTLKPGETHLQFAERMSSVLYGVQLKVGNFSLMLGMPHSWGLGTMDFQMVKLADRAGLLPPETRARLVSVNSKGYDSYIAPKTDPVDYRLGPKAAKELGLKVGDINPALPEHLRNLPWDPPGGKVTVFSGDYRVVAEAADILAREMPFSGGGSQWLLWDSGRSRFEAHMAAYPGAYKLPHMDYQAIVDARDAHRAVGYMVREDPVTRLTPPVGGMNPTEAFFYQRSPRNATRSARARGITKSYGNIKNWENAQWRAQEAQELADFLSKADSDHAQAHSILLEELDAAKAAGETAKIEGLQQQLDTFYQRDVIRIDTSKGWGRSVEDVPLDQAPTGDRLRAMGAGEPDSIAVDRLPNSAVQAVWYGPDGVAHGYAEVANTANPGRETISVYVDPEYRRQRVATRLYDRLAEEGTDIGAVSGVTVTAEGRMFSDAYAGDTFYQGSSTARGSVPPDALPTYDNLRHLAESTRREAGYARADIKRFVEAGQEPPEAMLANAARLEARAAEALNDVRTFADSFNQRVRKGAFPELRYAEPPEGVAKAEPVLRKADLLPEEEAAYKNYRNTSADDLCTAIGFSGKVGEFMGCQHPAGHQGTHVWVHAPGTSIAAERWAVSATWDQYRSFMAERGIHLQDDGARFNAIGSAMDRVEADLAKARASGRQDLIPVLEGEMRDLRKAMGQLVDDQSVTKGSTQFLPDGRALVRGFEAADFSTSIHEFGHVILPDLLDDVVDGAAARAWLGLKDGQAVTVAAHEKFARGLEKYIRDGKAPTPELEGVFQRARSFLVDIYRRIRGTSIDVRISPEMRGVYERLFQEVDPEAAAKRFDPRPDPVVMAIRHAEDSRRWKLTDDRAATVREELAQLGARTDLTPEEAARFGQLTTSLDQHLIATGEAVKGRVLYMASRDASISREIPLHRSLDGAPAEIKADLAVLNARMRELYPTYEIKHQPKMAHFYKENQGHVLAQYFDASDRVAEVLSTWGGVGRITQFLDWLTAPLENSRLGNASRQALYNQLLPKGAKVSEVNAFIKALAEESKLHTIGPMEVRAFRNGTALTAQTINKIAAGDKLAGRAPIFSPKVIEIIGADNFAKYLDQASNRFVRWAQDTRIAPGKKGSFAAAVDDVYRGYQATKAGDVTRLVGKTMYHWLRFISDPRWWAMNVLEADMIGGARYGLGATRLAKAQSALPERPYLAHELGREVSVGAKTSIIEEALGDGQNGWLYTRRLGGYGSRAFDHERPQSVFDFLREIEGSDTYRGLENLARQTKDIRDPNVAVFTEDIVDALDKYLYDFDTKGSKATVFDEAKAIFDDQVLFEGDPRAGIPPLAPVVQKIWERNDGVWQDIQKVFHGNPSRSTLERAANSYWLFWPLSYQLKAGKWLWDTMTHKFGGARTGMTTAALWNHYYQRHKETLANDPSYAAMFEEHPTAWFVAQMLFPITPVDLGVSLSRPLRFTGAKLGLWGDYQSAKDPVTAAGAILSFGPTYTAELMARLGRELFKEPTKNLFPSTGSGQTIFSGSPSNYVVAP